MGIDWASALASGIASGAGAVSKEYQDQQDEQRWLEKQKQIMAMQSQAAQSRERYLAALSPPKTDVVHTTDEQGNPIVQNRQWVAPSDEDIAAGKPGRFDVTSTGKDINFEKLDETQRNNDLRNQQAQDKITMAGQINEARMAAAQARLDAAAERGLGAERKGVIHEMPTDTPGVTAPWVSDGKGGWSPLTDKDGNPVTGQKSRPSVYSEKTKHDEAAAAARKAAAATSAPPEEPGFFSKLFGGGSPAPAAPAPTSTQPLSQFSGAQASPAASQGSSPANPVDYSPGMPKPPSGTYVRKPDGSVVRVP